MQFVAEKIGLEVAQKAPCQFDHRGGVTKEGKQPADNFAWNRWESRPLLKVGAEGFDDSVNFVIQCVDFAFARSILFGR